MTNLEILRKEGGPPIVVPNNAVKLEINEPLSELLNVDEVIGSLANLEALVLYVTDYGKVDFTDSLSFLRGANRLKWLSLRSMSHLQDCETLKECKSLEWLSLARHVVPSFDFSVLPSMAALRSLTVEMADNATLGRIAKASHLTALLVLGGFKLESLEPLAGLANLGHLRLWSGALASSRGLKKFDKMEVLDLGYSKIRDTSELGSLKGLKKMELIGNKDISNLEFLHQSDLEFLGMFEIPELDSLKPLLRLPKLKEFRSEARILDDDLLPLLAVQTLEKAFIPGRYKAALKKLRADSGCTFKVGRETLRVTKEGVKTLETASEAKQRLKKKLAGS